MDIQSISQGSSWACKFKTVTFLDAQGLPIQAKVEIGQAHPGIPGEYQGLGVIKRRDCDKHVVELVDVSSGMSFVVPWENCWDIDSVEWI